MTSAPLFVHCCHCSRCRRETGTAFALNALIETSRIERLAGTPEAVTTPTASGLGQHVQRCPHCRVALWSHYAGAGEAIAFVRVGTLDDPGRYPPDIHIYTDARLPWVTLPGDAVTVPAYYKASAYWPPDSLARFAALRADSKR